MKHFFKESGIGFLLILFIGLLFILWGRLLIREMKLNAATKNLSTTADRVRCLSFYGWEADPASETWQKTAIPDPLDSVFVEYNKLQVPCGFNLERYRGKTAADYRYLLLNFPYTTDQPVYAHLLIVDGELIGGDVMTADLGGFMLPLDRNLFNKYAKNRG